MENFLIHKDILKIFKNATKTKHKITFSFLKVIIKIYKFLNFNKYFNNPLKRKKIKFSFKLKKQRWKIFKRRKKKYLKRKIIRIFKKLYKKLYWSKTKMNHPLKKKLKKKIFLKIKNLRLLIELKKRPYRRFSRKLYRIFKNKVLNNKNLKYSRKIEINLKLKLFRSNLKKLITKKKRFFFKYKKSKSYKKYKKSKILNFFLIKKKNLNNFLKPLRTRQIKQVKKMGRSIHKHFTYWPKYKKHFFLWIKLNKYLKNSLKSIRLLCHGFRRILKKFKKTKIFKPVHFRRSIKNRLSLQFKKKHKRRIFPERLQKPLIKLFWKSQLIWKKFFSDKVRWTTKKFKYKFNSWFKKTQKISKFIDWRKQVVTKDQLWFLLIKFNFFLSHRDCKIAYDTGLILLNGNLINTKKTNFLDIGDIVSLHFNYFKLKKLLRKRIKISKRLVKKTQYLYFKNSKIWWKKPKKNPHPDVILLISRFWKIPSWIEFDELTLTLAFIKKPKFFIHPKTVSFRHSLEKLNTFKLNV